MQIKVILHEQKSYRIELKKKLLIVSYKSGKFIWKSKLVSKYI